MQNSQSKTAWQERAARLFVVLSLLAVAYFFMKTIVRLLLPFLLAAALAALIRPIAAFLERKCKMPKKVASILLLILLLFFFGVLIVWGCERLILELQKLMNQIGTDGAAWSARISHIIDVVTRLSEHIPFLARIKSNGSLTAFWNEVDAKLAEIITDTLTRYSTHIPDLITSVIRGIPGALIFLLTFVLAAFYLCADLTAIGTSLISHMPEHWQSRLSQSKQTLSQIGGNYLRAYFSLFLLTFFELLVGFTFLHLPYIFLPSLLIALVDILPVFGVGTVLVPWGLIELLRGNVGRGTALLVLCAIILLIRQLVEPRIVGKSIGLHPLATLFAAYAGLQLFGLLGMLLGPAVALLVKGWVWPQGEVKA
jgi:sporulation integral membrane protein YtvI